MASKASSPEASEVRRRGRQRLIGAVAIVLMLVVFVPMILDPEPRPAATNPVLTIPPKDNAPPLPAPPAAAKPAPVAPQPQAVVTQAVTTPPLPVPVPPAPAAKVEVEPKPSAPSDAKAAPKLEGFAVQVGAFRDEAKLKQAREKLQAAGVVHYTERLETRSGPLTRLRAGPFANRGEAEAALAKLRRGALDGKVVPLS